MKHLKLTLGSFVCHARLVSTLALGAAGLLGCTGSLIDNDGGEASPRVPGAGAGTGSGGGGNAPGAGGTTGVGGAEATGGTATVSDGPGRVVMHRLNRTEYDNTVRDLLETNLRLSESAPPDDTAHGFDNIASALSMTDVTLGHYSDSAKRLAAEALSPARRSRLVGCDLAVEQETCVASVLANFLPRAWRRPVEPGEIERLVTLYTVNKADGSTDDDALSRVIQAVLMAPEFLFRVEANSGVAGVRDLNGYELASRLSYFLWSSMPDAELTSAAASGALHDPAGLAAQVERMLGHTKAEALAENFGSQWLRMRSLENVQPDPEVYPDFDDELRASMRAETMRFFADIAAGRRPLHELITSDSGFINDRLAEHYGLPPVGSSEPVFTALPVERGGLLTQASILTVLSHPAESAPVLRGKWILGNLFCREPLPPPPDIAQEPPPQEGRTRKERLAAHRTEDGCRACHELMDPLGLAFEQYDGIGAFRTTDGGVVIDPAGVFNGQAFSTPAELEQIIAGNPLLPRCVAQHVFTYGLGRAPRQSSPFDSRTLDQLAESFTSAGQLFPALVEAIVDSEAFRKREDEATTP